MTVFNQEDPKPEDQNQQETQVDYVKQLVDAKANEKFSDIQMIAKSKLESDQHIATLESQLKELREDLEGRVKPDDVQAMVREMASSLSVEKDTSEAGTPASQEDLQSLILSTLEGREKAATEQSNLSQVNKQLEETFGTEAEKTVKEKLASMGMSFERGMELAKESPSAFMALVGQPVKTSSNSVPKSEVNPIVQTSSNERTYAYYSKLRKENPKLYYSPKVQLQMGEDRNRLGAEAWNS